MSTAPAGRAARALLTRGRGISQWTHQFSDRYSCSSHCCWRSFSAPRSSRPAKVLLRGERPARGDPPMRSLKRVEVPTPKARILVVDYDWATLQAEFFIQRAAA